MSKANSYKVLIAEDDKTTARYLADFLSDRGFEVEIENKADALEKKLVDWKPHFCLCNLMLENTSGIKLLQIVKEKALLTKVFITSAHNDINNVKAALNAGANDYIVKPFKNEDILSRLVFHIQKKRAIPNEKDQSDTKDENLLTKLMQLVLREANAPKRLKDILFNHTKMLELTLKAVRCNLVTCDEDRQTGFVVVSSDERGLFGLQIDLNKYPEIIHVMNTEKMVVIENMENDPTMAAIKDKVKSISFNAIIVAPVFKRGQFYGVLAARMPKEKGGFEDKDVRFAQLLSQIVSLVVSMDHDKELQFEKKSSNKTAA